MRVFHDESLGSLTWADNESSVMIKNTIYKTPIILPNGDPFGHFNKRILNDDLWASEIVSLCHSTSFLTSICE